MPGPRSVEVVDVARRARIALFGSIFGAIAVLVLLPILVQSRGTAHGQVYLFVGYPVSHSVAGLLVGAGCCMAALCGACALVCTVILLITRAQVRAQDDAE